MKLVHENGNNHIDFTINYNRENGYLAGINMETIIQY